MVAALDTMLRRPAVTGVRVSTGMALFACAVFVCVVFWPTILSLDAIWSDADNPRPTYKHGYIVVLVTAWLIVRERTKFAAVPPQGSPVAMVAVCAASLAWMVAWRAGLQIVHQLLLPWLLWGAFVAVAGLRAAQIVLFPIAYLYFAIPVWDAATPLLQWLTTEVNETLLAFVGIPAWVHDNSVTIPAGTFVIEQGCSGLHYLIVTLAIAALHGEVHRDSLRTRLLVTTVAAGFALLTNWLRVFTIIVAGHLTDMQHFLVKVDHYYFGWVLFAIGLLGLIWLARRLPTPAEAVAEIRSAGATRGVSLVALLLTFVALGIGPGIALTANLRTPPSGLVIEAPQVAGLAPPQAYSGPWRPTYPDAHGRLQVIYRMPDGLPLIVYAAIYLEQSQGHELIGYGRSVLGDGWRMIENQRRGSAVLEAEAIDSGLQRHLVQWRYRVGGHWFDSELSAQLLYAMDSSWRRTPAAVIALSAPCRPDCEHARAVLADSGSLLFEEVAGAIP